MHIVLPWETICYLNTEQDLSLSLFPSLSLSPLSPPEPPITL